jgi:hypothetical protein
VGQGAADDETYDPSVFPEKCYSLLQKPTVLREPTAGWQLVYDHDPDLPPLCLLAFMKALVY